MIRLWSIGSKSFSHIRSINVPKHGCVNRMAWAMSGDTLVCGIGNEPRMGRWDRVKGAKNGLFIIKLPVGCLGETAAAEIEAKEDQKESPDDEAAATAAESVSIEWQSAETWDRWDAREKGDFSKVVASSDQSGDSSSSVSPTKEKKSDEWSEFFGKLYK